LATPHHCGSSYTARFAGIPAENGFRMMMAMATAWPNLLDSAESVFRLVVDEAKEYAIFLLDEHGRIESWNPGAELIFDRPAADTIGQNFSILFTEADRAAGVPERELATAREARAAERWAVGLLR